MENNKHYFYKIANDDLAQKVIIPSRFVKHISEDLSEDVITNATIRSSVITDVKIRKISGDTCIEEGWPLIMEEHSLGNEEILVFRYDGNMCFTLHILEKTGCERDYDVVVVPNEEVDDYDEGNYSVNPENLQLRMYLKENFSQPYYTVRFPRAFSKLMPWSPTETITVQNMKGESWTMMATLRNGSYHISQKWREFMLTNNLTLGGDCIFELVENKIIRVHKVKSYN